MVPTICAIEYWPQHGSGMAITLDDERSQSGVVLAVSIFKAMSMVLNSCVLEVVVY